MAKHFKCEICNKKFSDKYNLSSHMHVHTTETPFSCSQCTYRGKTKKYLARHMKQVHRGQPRDHKCSVCGKLFLHQSNLKVHAMVHTGEKPHKCNVCGKTFRVTYSLNSHMLIHKNEKPFECSFCDYACRDNSTLRKHQNKHMGLEKVYQCKICNKGYKSRAALKIHIAETHLDLDMKKFPCNHCDKMFKTNAHRKSHTESVHKRSLVCNCPICGRKLMNKNNLSAHMRTHLEERPFSCTHPGCNVSFKDKNSLTKHTVIHNPDQHFPCSHCGRKFARKSHRKQHERVMHLERTRSFECHHCGSRFYSKNYLIKHIQTKHVYKQQFKYICDKCGLTTYNKPSIVMHLKYGHSNEHDLQCKICDNKTVFKRHMYLKQHYWKTHNIRYKITKTGNKKSKKERKSSVEIKVEPIEADSYEEIQLLDVQKHENDDLIDESLDYSKSVLSEDIAASVLRDGARGSEVEFDEFFIRHVFAKQEDKNDDKVIDGVDKEQDEYVKRRIKQILIRTEKIQKAREKKKKKKEEAIAQAKRESEELEQLRRVRVLYNERMEAALLKERETKESIKINYFKKATEHSSNTIKNTKDSVNSKGNKYLSDENNVSDARVVNETIHENELNDNHLIPSNDDNDEQRQDNDIDDNEIEKSNFINNCNNESIEINNDENNISNNDLEKSDVVEEYIDQNTQGNDKESVDSNCFNETNTDDHKMSGNDNNEHKITENKQNSQDTRKEIESIQENDKIQQSLNEMDIIEHKTKENEQNVQDVSEEIEPIKENDEIEKFDTKNHDSENSSEDDKPLLLRRVKRKCTKKIDYINEITNNKAKKMQFKTYQCYICFKLYQTKQELTTHCQEHFDICHSRTLSKCPLCEHVSHKGLAKHMRTEHDTELSTLHNTIRGDDGDGSGYSYDINGTLVQVIPSVSALNKTASNKIDKDRRDLNDKLITKSKLVKKGKEWIVEKESMPIEFDVIPELSDRELSKLKVTDNDVERLGQLSYLVKKQGLKMLFPCFKCDKICQNFAALKLHQRRHEVNPKPFKPRVKNTDKTLNNIKKIKLDKSNRKALPKPIKNKHKCDEKLKKFFESNIRGGDIEFWQFLKIYNKMDREKVNDFTDLEKRSDFGNHLDYYKDEEENDVTDNESSNLVTKTRKE